MEELINEARSLVSPLTVGHTFPLSSHLSKPSFPISFQTPPSCPCLDLHLTINPYDHPFAIPQNKRALEDANQAVHPTSSDPRFSMNKPTSSKKPKPTPSKSKRNASKICDHDHKGHDELAASPTPPTKYVSLTTTALKLLQKRNLPKYGNNSVLIARLLEADLNPAHESKYATLKVAQIRLNLERGLGRWGRKKALIERLDGDDEKARKEEENARKKKEKAMDWVRMVPLKKEDQMFATD